MTTTHDWQAIRQQFPVDEILRTRYNTTILKGGRCRCPIHHDKNPSASVFPSKRDRLLRFSCHACGIEAYDAIQLVKHMEGLKDMGEALRVLQGDDTPRPQAPRPEIEPELTFRFLPVPPDAPRIVAGKKTPEYTKKNGHRKTIVPEDVFEYFDDNGEMAGVVLRWKSYEGEKAFMPLRWAEGHGWVSRGWEGDDKPPLFNLPELLSRPKATVLVVEGEKSCRFAKAAFPDLVVTTWMGGCKAVNRRDFSALNGRNIILWPDNDASEGGLKAMRSVAKLSGAASIRMVELNPEWPQGGFDVADLLQLPDGKGKARAALEDAQVYDVPGAAALATAAQVNALRGDVQSPGSWLPEGVHLFLTTTAEPKVDFKSIHNVLLALEHHPLFMTRVAYDVFERQMTYDGQPLTMAVAQQLSAELRRATLINVHPRELHDALHSRAIRNPVNAFGDQVRALAGTWDRQLRYVADYAGVRPTAWSRAVSIRWMVGLARRVMSPGSKHDGILVLEGRQGQRKTSFFETLGNIFERDTYVALSHITKDEELAPRLAGKAIYELAEMHASKAEASLFKDIITRRIDRYRPKYTREYVDMPRAGVFGATTNARFSYLNDATGNRRIWPLASVDAVDIAGLERDREQLWAQAAAQALEGEPNWLQPHEEALHEAEIKPREVENPVIDKLELILADKARKDFLANVDLKTAAGILSDETWIKVRPAYLEAFALLGWRPGQGHDLAGRKAKGFRKGLIEGGD